MTNDELLNLKIESDDFGDDLTIKGYFEKLLLELWAEGESFSGKRPFGNSDWECDLYRPLVKAGAVDGTVDDEFGGIEECNYQAANDLIIELIKHCFK